MQTDVLYSREEYLALDAEAEDVKYEFDGAEVYAMAGASTEHNDVASNVSFAFRSRLVKRRCRVWQSDMRVRAGSSYAYPDVVALCANPEVTDEKPPSLLNPELIVEVASSSTAEKDRTWKLERYLQIESLQEYWIIETEVPRVQQYVRVGNEWTVRTHSGLGSEVRCELFSLEVALEEVYQFVIEEANGTASSAESS